MMNSGNDLPKRDLHERTFEFARRIVKLCQLLDQTQGVSRTLADQLLQAGTSIGANTEEPQAGQSLADFLSTLTLFVIHYFFFAISASRIARIRARCFVTSGGSSGNGCTASGGHFPA